MTPSTLATPPMASGRSMSSDQKAFIRLARVRPPSIAAARVSASTVGTAALYPVSDVADVRIDARRRTARRPDVLLHGLVVGIRGVGRVLDVTSV